MEKVRIAMIGVGAISGIYLQNITKVFREVDLVGVCDLIPERAQKGAGYVEEQIKEGAAVRQPKIYKDMYEAFNDPEVEVILNLTRPHEHYEVTKQGLLHGKHVYSEKPWPWTWTRPRSWWLWPRRRACAWAARRTPLWAPVSRPPGG